MPRTVYLVVYTGSGLFPAHWGLFIPHIDNEKIGKFIHAKGDAANGFEIAFERNYNLGATSRSHKEFTLAEVLDEHVVDVKGDESRTTDQKAHDRLEEVALSIPAPGRSLVPATSQGPRKKVAIQNCQTWLREVVAALVQFGVMTQENLQNLDSAPKN